MPERQLADLLVSTGLDRNINIEKIASELAALSLPSYIDKAAFQRSLLDAIEAQLYKQTDERIRLLRQQLVAGPGLQGRVQVQTEPEPESVESEAAQPEPPPEPEEDEEQPAPSDQDLYEERDTTMVEAEDIPEDATMIWKRREERY